MSENVSKRHESTKKWIKGLADLYNIPTSVWFSMDGLLRTYVLSDRGKAYSGKLLLLFYVHLRIFHSCRNAMSCWWSALCIHTMSQPREFFIDRSRWLSRETFILLLECPIPARVMSVFKTKDVKIDSDCSLANRSASTSERRRCFGRDLKAKVKCFNRRNHDTKPSLLRPRVL